MTANSHRPAARRPLAQWFAARDARDVAIVLAFLAAAAGLLWCHPYLQRGWEIALWSLGGLALLIVLGCGWLRFFGPLLYYDLVRLARRRHCFAVRTAYVSGLLLLLAALYSWWSWNPPEGGLSPRELSRFAELFLLIFMAAQFLAVLVLTPAFAASTIAGEKDLHTLEFLLATDLDKREIVLSKVATCLAYLGVLLLSGLPLLSFTQFFGGIDPNLVLVCWGVLALTTLSLAGLSVLHSVYARRARTAIVLTYLTVALYLSIGYVAAEFVPEALEIARFGFDFDWQGTTYSVTVQSVVDALNAGNLLVALRTLVTSWRQGLALTNVVPKLTRDYAIFHTLAALVFTLWAVARLRAVSMDDAVVTAKTARRRWWTWPSLDADVLLWKEVALDPGLRLSRLTRILLTALAVASFVPAGSALWNYYVDCQPGVAPGVVENLTRNLRNEIQTWARFVGTLVGCVTLLAVAIRAAGTVSGERDRHSLDALLTTPLNRDAILYSKWQASILTVRWCWLWLGLIWAVAIAVGALSWYALPLLIWAWFVYAMFAANLGVWFSTVCSSTLKASLFTLLTLLLVAFGHWLTLGCYMPFFLFSSGRKDEFPEWLILFQTYGLTPPITLSALVFTMDDLRKSAMVLDGRISEGLAMLVGALMGIIIYGIGASLLWKLASNRFRALGIAQPLHKGIFGGSENPFVEEVSPDVELVPLATPVESTPVQGRELEI